MLDERTSFKNATGLMQECEWTLKQENPGWITDLPGLDWMVSFFLAPFVVFIFRISLFYYVFQTRQIVVLLCIRIIFCQCRTYLSS